MTVRVTEVFLISLLVSLVAVLAAAAAAHVWDESWAAAIPWGVLAGGATGAIAAIIQHVTGFTYLSEGES